MKPRYLLLSSLLILFCNAYCKPGHALTPAEIRQRAVVMIDGAPGNETAVCIYGRGVFITSARNVENKTKVRLLAPWLPQGKNAFELLVWRVDKPHDLAVLVPEKPFPANFASIPLGDLQSLKVKAPVAFFGFSTENKTNPNNAAMPLVAMANASVVSLSQPNDKTPVVRVLAAAPRMKAGGPLLDRDGKLIGLMQMVALLGSNPSTAIPVTAILRALLPKVTVQVAPTNSGKSDAAQQLFIALETAEQHGGRIPGDTGIYNEMDERPLYDVELAIGDGENWHVSPVSRVQVREFAATDIRITDEKKPLFYKISVLRDSTAVGNLTGPLVLLPDKISPTKISTSPQVPLVLVPLVPEQPKETEKLTFLEPVQNPLNRHWYQVATSTSPVSWDEANNIAATRIWNGLRGHLATVTDAREQGFVQQSIVPKLPNRKTGYWLGAAQDKNAIEPAGGWRWITGEPWQYTGWGRGEPNQQSGDPENYLELFPQGGWNDTSAISPEHHGLLIEFEDPLDKAPGAVSTPIKLPTSPEITKPSSDGNLAPRLADSDKTWLNLPGHVTDVTVGGAGRFIVFYFQALRKIAIFDARQGKIERYISVPADEAYLAAGMDKLVVILPNESIIQRWNLLTGERELSTLLPGGFIAAGAGMGAASQGPVGIVQQSNWGGPDSGGPIVFFDLQKLQPMDIKVISSGVNPRGIEGKNVRASGDGTLFSAWVNDGSPRMGNVAMLSGSVLSNRVGVADVGLILPSPDGRTIYTSVGLFTPDMKQLDGRADGRRNEEMAFLPSYSPAFYLGINGSNRSWRGGGFGDKQPPPVELSLYSTNDRRIITKLATLDEVGDPMAGVRSSDRLPADKRIFFVPAYNLLITLSSARDQLVLRPINLLSILQKLDVDYLFVKSRPMEAVTIGRAYVYPIEVVARRAITFKLESGPTGMTISEKGFLVWAPPANYVGEEEVVIVSIHDAAGQEIFHTFRIQVQRAS